MNFTLFNRCIALVTITFILSTFIFAQTGHSKKPKGQTQFSAEDSLSNPVKLPPYIIEEILFAEKYTEPNEYKKEREEQLKSSLEGTHINLDNDDHPDLLVAGDPGANCEGFWLFRNVKGRFKLVFYQATHDLKLKNTFAKGLRNIYTYDLSAAGVVESRYKYNGKEYKAIEHWEEGDGIPRHKIKYYDD